MSYEFFNANPQNKKAPDCAIRALSKTLSQDWYKTYDDLTSLGKELANTPTAQETIQKYLDKKGFLKKTFRAVKGQKRMNVAHFCKEFPTGSYVLRLANHIVSVVNGKYYDIWDCGECCVYGYYERIKDVTKLQ